MSSPSQSQSSDVEGDLSRDQVMSMYMESARRLRKRAAKTIGQKGKKRRTESSGKKSTDMTEGQIWLSVTKMEYSNLKGKGVMKKGEVARKIFVNEEAEYQQTLNRIREALFGEAREEDEKYYLADSSGFPLTNDGTITVHKRDGSCERHQWTLKKWMQVSGIRYQSRARLYCVRKVKEDEQEKISSSSSEDDLTDNTVAQQSQSLPGPSQLTKPDKQYVRSTLPLSKSSRSMLTDENESLVLNEREVTNIEDPNTPKFSEWKDAGSETVTDWEPLFAKVTKSRYAEHFTFIDNQTKDSTIAGLRLEEKDGMESFETLNPCMYGYIFHGVRKSREISLIENYNQDNGSLEFGAPCPGAELDCWIGGDIGNNVAVLICFALNGYHAIAHYRWCRNNKELIENRYPVLYTNTTGDYICNIKCNESCISREFSVFDENGKMLIKVVSQTLHDTHVGTDWEPLLAISYDDLQDSYKIPKLGSIIGEGTFGKVYKAVWKGSVVAAKVISVPAGSEDTVQQEITMCKSIQHPNILHLLGSVRLDKKIMILSTLVHGSNLQDLINKSFHELTFIKKKSIAVQMAQAITFLHNNIPKIVHLDVKPANLLVEQSTYHVSLADFGVSKVLNSTMTTMKTNSSASSIGTPGYQPLEQLEAGVITESVDIYAIGCVLIELFSGKRVWDGLSALQIVVKVVSEKRVPDISEISHAQVRQLISMCLRGRKERPSSVQVLSSLLKLTV